MNDNLIQSTWFSQPRGSKSPMFSVNTALNIFSGLLQTFLFHFYILDSLLALLLPSFFPCLLTYLLTYLFTYLLTYLLTCLLACLLSH